jgi:hypothetical protein
MPGLTLSDMRDYLSRSLSSVNANKTNGLLAEIDFRDYLVRLGFESRVSVGGWVLRSTAEAFGEITVAVFPYVIAPDTDLPLDPSAVDIPLGLHTICATMHQLGIRSYFAIPSRGSTASADAIEWNFIQLGLPTSSGPVALDLVADRFKSRTRRHNFLRNKSNTTPIPDRCIPEEFCKENLRVFFQTAFMSEISDIDSVLWGERFTYPIEIKEKTAAHDKTVGDYFGIDAGPFVKLAHFAARKGNMNALFIVREIVDRDNRALKKWWFIRFDQLTEFASWVPIAGGRSMGGGASSVIKIPKKRFAELNAAALQSL